MNNQHNANNSKNPINVDDDKKHLLDSASSSAMANAIVRLMNRLIRPPLFALGHVAVTPGALDLLDRTGTNANTLLARHQRGDRGSICECDAAENNLAVKGGERVLSSYELGEQQERIWIITEHDRSATTLLLPKEY